MAEGVGLRVGYAVRVTVGVRVGRGVMLLTRVLVGLGEGECVALGDSTGGKKSSLIGVSDARQLNNPIMISKITRVRAVLPAL